MVRDLLDRGLQAIAIQGGGEAALALVGAVAGLGALGVAARHLFRGEYEVMVLPQDEADAAADLANALRMPRWVSTAFIVKQLVQLGLSESKAREWAHDIQKDPNAGPVLIDCLLTRSPEVGKKVALAAAGLPFLNVVNNGWEVRAWLVRPTGNVRYGVEIQPQDHECERQWSIAHDRLAADAKLAPDTVLQDLVRAAGDRLPQWMRQSNVGRLGYYSGCPVMLRWEQPEPEDDARGA